MSQRVVGWLGGWQAPRSPDPNPGGAGCSPQPHPAVSNSVILAPWVVAGEAPGRRGAPCGSAAPQTCPQPHRLPLPHALLRPHGCMPPGRTGQGGVGFQVLSWKNRLSTAMGCARSAWRAPCAPYTQPVRGWVLSCTLGARCTRPAPCQGPGARGGRGTSPLPAPGAGAPGLPRRVPAQPASPAAPAWLRDPPGGRAGIAPAGSGARWQPPAQLCCRLPLTVGSELLGCTWADVPRDGGKGPAVRAALGARSSALPTLGTSPSHGTTKCLLPEPRSCRGWGWLCRWGGTQPGCCWLKQNIPQTKERLFRELPAARPRSCDAC